MVSQDLDMCLSFSTGSYHLPTKARPFLTWSHPGAPTQPVPKSREGRSGGERKSCKVINWACFVLFWGIVFIHELLSLDHQFNTLPTVQLSVLTWREVGSSPAAHLFFPLHN